jgi:hypothetical protein
MADIAICAVCGEERELCNACREEGIMQPRYCRECLIKSMNSGNYDYNDVYWLAQMKQLENKPESSD